MLPWVRRQCNDTSTIAADQVFEMTCNVLGVPTSRMQKGGDLEEMALRVRQGCVDQIRDQVQAAWQGAKK